MKNPGKTGEKTGNGLNRRDFLKTASLAAAAASSQALFGPVSIIAHKAQAQPGQTDQVKVIVSRDEGASQGSIIVTDYVQLIMDEGIRQLTGIFDIGTAYKSLFPGISSDSVIGIKVNCINPYLPTHPQVVDAMINSLLLMEIDGTPFPANNIIIWDRLNSELAGVGYTLNTGTDGVRCFGTNEVDYNSLVELNCNGTIQHPSRILTDYIDYNIDFAVMKNAGGCGLTMTLKNYYGGIDAPGNLHDGNCDPGIPSVNAAIRDELDVVDSLFIVDAIFGTTFGGPTGPPNLVYNGLIMGFDRVAVDSIGREILEENGCTTTGLATHIETAAGDPYNLGTNSLEEIHRIDINEPSAPVEGLRVNPLDRHVELTWMTDGSYSGYYKILRSIDPTFATAQEIGQTRYPYFVDARVLSNSQKNFYRVQKTW